MTVLAVAADTWFWQDMTARNWFRAHPRRRASRRCGQPAATSAWSRRRVPAGSTSVVSARFASTGLTARILASVSGLIWRLGGLPYSSLLMGRSVRPAELGDALPADAVVHEHQHPLPGRACRHEGLPAAICLHACPVIRPVALGAPATRTAASLAGHVVFVGARAYTWSRCRAAADWLPVLQERQLGTGRRLRAGERQPSARPGEGVAVSGRPPAAAGPAFGRRERQDDQERMSC